MGNLNCKLASIRHDGGRHQKRTATSPSPSPSTTYTVELKKLKNLLAAEKCEELNGLKALTEEKSSFSIKCKVAGNDVNLTVEPEGGKKNRPNFSSLVPSIFKTALESRDGDKVLLENLRAELDAQIMKVVALEKDLLSLSAVKDKEIAQLRKELDNAIKIRTMEAHVSAVLGRELKGVMEKALEHGHEIVQRKDSGKELGEEKNLFAPNGVKGHLNVATLAATFAAYLAYAGSRNACQFVEKSAAVGMPAGRVATRAEGAKTRELAGLAHLDIDRAILVAAGKNLTVLKAAEGVFHRMISSRTKWHEFPPMKSEKRQLIHSMAEMYGMHSQDLVDEDGEIEDPKRDLAVVGVELGPKSMVPTVIVSEALVLLEQGKLVLGQPRLSEDTRLALEMKRLVKQERKGFAPAIPVPKPDKVVTTNFFSLLEETDA
ncbi:hypothetical protein HDU97_003443 [Phlyctochytrium planicorne]|nr:hypothetical protein HDU97_003443 [Phlyctochytrium planicorne]